MFPFIYSTSTIILSRTLRAAVTGGDSLIKGWTLLIPPATHIFQARFIHQQRIIGNLYIDLVNNRFRPICISWNFWCVVCCYAKVGTIYPSFLALPSKGTVSHGIGSVTKPAHLHTVEPTLFKGWLPLSLPPTHLGPPEGFEPPTR